MAAIKGKNKMFKLAIIVAVIAMVATLVMRKMSGKKPESAAAKPKEVVAAVDIFPYTVITSAMVTAKEVSGAAATPGSFSDVQQVIGKITRGKTARDQVILPDNLKDPAAGRLARGFDVPMWERGLAVAVLPTEEAGGLIREGDTVDVIAVRDPGEGEVVARTIIQRVLVLAAEDVATTGYQGEKPKAEEKPAEQPAKSGQSKAQAPPPPPKGEVERKKRLLVLSVVPEQAERLAAAEKNDTIVLTLRNFEDTSKIAERPLPRIRTGKGSGTPVAPRVGLGPQIFPGFPVPGQPALAGAVRAGRKGPEVEVLRGSTREIILLRD